MIPAVQQRAFHHDADVLGTPQSTAGSRVAHEPAMQQHSQNCGHVGTSQQSNAQVQENLSNRTLPCKEVSEGFVILRRS